MDDRAYMELAYQLALKGKTTTSPNPMVGAVVVRKGRIVATGWHKRCGGPHAEAIALRKAGRLARGATLYVTLEPCHHYGRTPPCVDAVIKSGIKKAVIGMTDPNPLTNGKSVKKLRQNGIAVRSGVMEKDLRRMNEVFEKYITKKTPWVTAKIAQTLDGKIATANGQSKWITALSTRNFTRRLRNEFDAILVGVNTVLKDDPCLCAARPSKHLQKIVLDSALRIPLTAKMFRQNPQDCLIATTRRASPEKIAKLSKEKVRVLVCPERSGKVDLRWLLRTLAKKEVASVLIEGGPTVIGEALKQKLVDKLRVFIAPKVLGDEQARSAVVGLQCADVNKSINLRDVRIQKIGPDLFIEAYPIYR